MHNQHLCVILNVLALAMTVIFLLSVLFLMPQQNLHNAESETMTVRQNTRFENVTIANSTMLAIVLLLALANMFSSLGDKFVQMCVFVCRVYHTLHEAEPNAASFKPSTFAGLAGLNNENHVSETNGLLKI